MVKVISLKYETTFKRVFGQPPVFCQFTQDILGIPVNINQVHTEYEYPEAVGYVKTKYDLFAEDKEQRIIIEIQHVKEEDFFARFFYYHLTSIIEQVKSHTAYGFDQTVYTIIVLTIRWTIRLMKPITICQSFKGLSRILNGVQFRPKS
jgi:hypothetical protein